MLLEPGSLDRVGEPGDWLRREIVHALAHRRNVVPLLAGGVRMPPATDLPVTREGFDRGPWSDVVEVH